MSPPHWLCIFVLLSCFILNVLSQFLYGVIIGPSSPNEWNKWINDITVRRQRELELINYNGSIFKVVPLQWTQSSFIQPQMHGYDQYFYDTNSHSYTYDKWLNDLKNRYGGIDAFLFWVTYTNIGADDRNQFEMNYAVPGGLDALKKMINYMHKQDPPIKVLFPYNPWDQGTHDSGLPDYKMMAKFLNETGGDGFNGDTMLSIPLEFYSYSVSEYDHPIALEPEGDGDLQSFNYDTMGWGYAYMYYNITDKPLVGKWNWYDGRHLTNICNRWAKNHTIDIQTAYFNAIGFESWENVWGSWNGIVPRDGEAIRRTAAILRYFGNRDNNPKQQNFTQSLDWKPFIPIIEEEKYWNDLFASSFPVNIGSNDHQILFLIINRNDMDIDNAQITFNNTFSININDLHVYDCYYGKEINFTVNNDNQISVNIDIEGLGYGAILATMDTRKNNSYLDSYLNTMNAMTQKPLNSYSSEWHYLLQNMTNIASTKLYSSPPDPNMVTIPMGIFHFNNTGVEIEGDDDHGVDVQYPWESHPQREHFQTMTINKLYMDKYPVTCSEYNKYLLSSNYKPGDRYNYLKNWDYNNITDTYTFPSGYDNKPVTYLSLNEARLYCSFVGKRLPHSYEWQYSGQGNTSYLYPWGNEQKMGINFPQTQHGRVIPGPSDVDAFPSGDSIFGVSDLIGNVWQYTDEFTDIHTHAVVVMGSSNYRPNGSNWYFPTSYQLTQHNKYFLMDDSYERCGTIGFRCAADAVQQHTTIYNWNGIGTYCTDLTVGNGPLCGMINVQNRNNDLTKYGTLDWIHFGTNYKDNSKYKMIRKRTIKKYINNIHCSSTVKTYSNNKNSFYWNDGENDVNYLSINNATTNGIYLTNSSTFKWTIDNLKKHIYRLRIYVGVYKDGGTLDVKLNIRSNDYLFIDNNTIFNQHGMNIVYDIIINLESIIFDQDIQLYVQWIHANKGKGHVTLQAIALALA